MTTSNSLKYGTYVAMGLAALAFGGAGIAKLAGVEEIHRSILNAGWPPVSVYVIGCLEIAGVVGMFIKPLRVLAALGLAATALGAFLFHVVYTPIGEGIPALVLLALTCFLVFAFRRADA